LAAAFVLAISAPAHANVAKSSSVPSIVAVDRRLCVPADARQQIDQHLDQQGRRKCAPARVDRHRCGRAIVVLLLVVLAARRRRRS
jgi:hypothetical protein